MFCFWPFCKYQFVICKNLDVVLESDLIFGSFIKETFVHTCILKGKSTQVGKLWAKNTFLKCRGNHISDVLYLCFWTSISCAQVFGGITHFLQTPLLFLPSHVKMSSGNFDLNTHHPPQKNVTSLIL